MKIELDNETIVVAYLSGYIRELNEGKEFTETTLKTAKKITKIFDKPNN